MRALVTGAASGIGRDRSGCTSTRAPSEPTDPALTDSSFVETTSAPVPPPPGSGPDTQGAGGAAATDDALALSPELAGLPPELGLTPDFPRASESGPTTTVVRIPPTGPDRGVGYALVALALGALVLLGGAVVVAVLAAR